MRNVNEMDCDECRREIAQRLIGIKTDEVTDQLLVRNLPGLTFRIRHDQHGLYAGEVEWETGHSRIIVAIEPDEYQQLVMLRLSVLVVRMLDTLSLEFIRQSFKAGSVQMPDGRFQSTVQG